MPKKEDNSMIKKSNSLQLTEGSTYKITSLGTKDTPVITNGTFKGYSVVGNMDAICIELDKSHKELAGKVRIIPTHMVMLIDVVKAKEAKEEKKTEESVFYR
jgi:hypothetical protein